MAVRRFLVAGRYRLSEPVGAGGMGRVWLARDEMLDRDVAVKEFVPPDWMTDVEKARLRDRTLREARSAARLSHPHVVRIYDVVHADGRPWIVMEYIPSRSLHQVINEDGPLPPAEVARIGIDVLAALNAAHRAGVLHRDIKPHNVLIGTDGRVVLTDFGLATFVDDGAVTGPGLIVGSPQYVSPERARDGASTVESDLWSLGATLYAAVEGHSPYARDTAMATLIALATEDPDPPLLAGPLTPVLTGLLRHEATDRLTANEVDERLRAIVRPVARGRVVAARAVVPAPRRAMRGVPVEAGTDLAVAGGPGDLGPGGSGGIAATEYGRGVGSTGSGGVLSAGAAEVVDRDAGAAAAAADVALERAAGLAVGKVAVEGGPGRVVGEPIPGATEPAVSISGPPDGPSVPVSGPPGDGVPTGSEPALTGLPAVASDPPGNHLVAFPVSPGAGPAPASERRRHPRMLAIVAAVVAVAVLAAGAVLANVLLKGDGRHAQQALPPTPATTVPSVARAATGFTPAVCQRPAPSTLPHTPQRGAATRAKGFTLLPSWHEYVDPTGFRIGVPDGWTYQRIGTTVCFRDPDSVRFLSVDPARNPAGNPIKACRTEAQRLVTSGQMPGYRLVSLEDSALQVTAADWEYTWQGSAGARMHAKTRWMKSGTHAYAISWATRDFEWPTDTAFFGAALSTFTGIH
jgi:tRNA A-37 threonylcarbamoyl transferase component Bud32